MGAAPQGAPFASVNCSCCGKGRRRGRCRGWCGLAELELIVYIVILVHWVVLGAAVVQEVKKSFSNQKVASSIPCRSVLEQDTEPLIAPDGVCHQCKCRKCVYILVNRFGLKRLLSD